VRSWEGEIKPGQMTEDRGLMTEDRGLMTEDRALNSECGMRKEKKRTEIRGLSSYCDVENQYFLSLRHVFLCVLWGLRTLGTPIKL
jgi:hypothetical protein